MTFDIPPLSRDVVSAQAGTHNHRCFVLSRSSRTLRHLAPLAGRGDGVWRAVVASLAIVPFGPVRRHIAFGDIAGNGGVVAPRRIAIAAAARALQEEALARAHLDAGGGRRLVFLTCAEPHHEAGALAILAPGAAFGREAGLVEAADHGRILEQLVFAPHGEPAAPPSGARGIGDEIEAGDAAGKLGFENLDRRGVQVAEMRRGPGLAVAAHAAAI